MSRRIRYFLLMVICATQFPAFAEAAWPFFKPRACQEGGCETPPCERNKRCKTPPKPVFVYQFGARIQDDPLANLQSNNNETDERLNVLEDRVDEVFNELSDLLKILSEANIKTSAVAPSKSELPSDPEELQKLIRVASEKMEAIENQGKLAPPALPR